MNVIFIYGTFLMFFFYLKTLENGIHIVKQQIKMTVSFVVQS